MLRALLLFQILYTVYQSHYSFETGIPGINLPNVLFVICWVMVMRAPRAEAITAPAILKPAVLVWYGALLMAFLIALARIPGEFMLDINYLRTALFSPLLYFLYLRSKQSLEETRWMAIAVMVVAAIAGLQAIRQGLDYGIGTYNETHRASGPFGADYRDANRAGIYYCIFLPMFVGLAFFLRKQKMWFFAAIAGIGLLSMAILVTYSRQSYFIALVGAALVMLRRSTLLAILFSILAVVAVPLLPGSVTERVAETQQEDVYGSEVIDDSTSSRWEIWSGGLRMAASNPLGIGLNRFKTRIGEYVPRYKGYDAHNFYVLTLAEMGIQGLFALGLVFFYLFKLGFFLRKTVPAGDSEAMALAVGFSVTTVSVLLGNLYGSPFLEANVLGTYWILCGVLERYMQLKQQALVGGGFVTREPDPIDRFPLIARANPGLRHKVEP
ncbi:MAG: O-antigen ligase family protein [Dokdonella sp.]